MSRTTSLPLAALLVLLFATLAGCGGGSASEASLPLVALLVLLFATLAGCGGGSSASDDEVAAHDAEMTVQPVRCLECKQ